MPRLLIHVQHLLGSGHLVRALALAGAFAESGFRVWLLSGGFPLRRPVPEGVEFIQLPAMRALPGDFTALVDERGRPVDAAWKAARRNRLLAEAARIRPHAVLIETFPFGRRQLRFELLPLLERLETMQPRPLVAASIRDVLQQRKPSRWEETAEQLTRWFDLVLVHGDPRFLPLDASFPLAGRIEDRIRYTGYIHRPVPGAGTGGAPPSGEVVVSGGGGAVSEALLRSALGARPLSRLCDAPWRLLAGHALPGARFDSLRRGAGEGILVERSRPDFPALLARCRLSVSQGGYNTVLDILGAGAPAVIVPYAEGGETEQTTRARRLAELGRAVVLEESALSPPTLAAAVDAATELDPASLPEIGMDGLGKSVEFVRGALEARR